MELIAGHDETVAAWAAERLGGKIGFPNRAFGVVDDDGVLRAALCLVLHNEHTAELVIASDGGVTNGIAKRFFRLAFGDLGLWRIQCRTTKDNKQVKRAAPRWGFKFEGTARDYAGPGADTLMFGMTREDCRWVS